MTSILNESDSAVAIKPKSDFKVLIVYPNLPLMLVPGVAIGLFTRILKDQGYGVEMFETPFLDATFLPRRQPASAGASRLLPRPKPLTPGQQHANEAMELWDAVVAQHDGDKMRRSPQPTGNG